MSTEQARIDQPPSSLLQVEFLQANGNIRIDKLYPDHAEALFTADLVPPTDFPTFQELWQDNEKQKNEPIKSKD
eukprot:13060790-Ditylum_brightwellii.AAC.1